MRKFILGITIGLIGSAIASHFSFQGMRTTIGGKDCVVVATASGAGVSCNWNK